MSYATLRDYIWGGLVILLQLVIFRHLRFFGAEPDFVLVYLIWIMATRDRTTAIYHAAAMGLVLDITLDYWGIHMLVKVATMFYAYKFIPKIAENMLLFTQVFIVIFLVAFFHNLLMLGVASFAQSSRVDVIFINLLIGNAIFTSVIGSFIYMFKSN